MQYPSLNFFELNDFFSLFDYKIKFPRLEHSVPRDKIKYFKMLTLSQYYLKSDPYLESIFYAFYTYILNIYNLRF